MRSLQVIAICEFKEEDTESQILFWENLNAVVENAGYDTPDFAGFMADEARANWNAIRAVYNGGQDNIMEGRERSCLFHWKQSLQKYTRKLIPAEKQQEHINICEEWRACKTKKKFMEQSNYIHSWWDKYLPKEQCAGLKHWFKWWEQRVNHWGNIEDNVSTFTIMINILNKFLVFIFSYCI